MLFAWVDLVNADEVVVPNIVIPKGGTATLDIQLNNEQELNRTLQFYVKLPDGISVVTHSEVLGDRFSGTNVTVTGNLENDNRYVIYTINGFNESDNFPIPGNSGTIVTLDLTADESLEEGTVLNASIEDIEINLFFKDKEASPSDVPTISTFQISIGQPDDGRITFNETATELPPYPEEEPVNVSVARTIKANEWSTICLPFALNTEQVTEAFGEDVQLADFIGVETEEDAEEKTIGLTVNFSNVTNIEANHPYIIKVPDPVTTFTVDGVTIEPSEKVQVDRDEYTYTYKILNKTYTETIYNSFIGTYVAQTEIPSKALFLNSNKFYYSTGLTKMKAFRGYFNFYNILTEVDEKYEVKMFINGLETKVDGIAIKDATGTIYDLNGRKVAKPQQRGIYIVNGSKVVK